MKQTFRTLVLACVLGVGAGALATSPAMALREATPIPTDHRLQTVVYNANEVYKFTGHFNIQSMIEFEDGEEVVTISMGDSTAWQVVPSGNRIFLKPIVLDEPTTNMSVVTNKRVYHFELHGEEADEINDPSMVFVLRFIYGRGSGIGVSNYIDSVPDPTLEPEKYNFDYALTGTEVIAPIKIFDDGEFTYFEFRDKNAEIPAFFLVHGDGSEAIINFRTRDDYIVVERVAAQFTLRHGEDTVCVYNNRMRLLSSGPVPRPIDKKDDKGDRKRAKKQQSQTLDNNQSGAAESSTVKR